MGNEGLAIKLYRIGNWAVKKRIPIIPGFMTRLNRLVCSCDIPSETVIGRSTSFVHNGLGCVVNADAIIGENCRIYQNVSIAGRNGRGAPIIGNNVFIGAGACILGGVKIGDGASIGANAVVISDVPAFSVAVGIPAKIVKNKTSQEE